MSGTTFTLTDTDANTTVFTKAASAATTWTLSSSATAVDDTTVTTVSETITSGTATLARPKYVISPTGAVTAATCQATPTTKGCRVLEFVYASSTTATSSALGDYAGQVKAIKLWATTPGASAATAETLTSYAYDENKPGDAVVSGLVTSTVTGATIPGYATDADTSTATTTYDWSTGQEKATEGGDTTASVTSYDDAGRVATTRTPGSSGSDAGTLTYTYYSASATGTCASAEWAGLLCRTAPAAAITGGGSNPTQAVTTVYTYDRWGQVATKAETANDVTRTTTNTVDGAGRPTRTAITGGSGEATPATTITYDEANGQLATQTSNSQTIAYGYDDLGRQTSYSDGAGNTSTTAYDVLDRSVKTTDSTPSTVTYAYGTAGTMKTLTDSVAGTFTGTYDADGTLVTETLPGSYTLTVTTDPAGQETGREYTTSDGTTVASDTAGYTVTGRRSGHTLTDGSTTETAYTYDSAGRLTKAADTTATGCTTRAYTFDANSNRTALTTSSDDCDSSTSDTTANTTSYTYDSADRLVNSGYVYDAFGRTTTSGSTTLAYYTNDLVRTETLGTSRNSWSLDAAGRLAVRTAQTQATDDTWTTSSTTTSHYGCGCDSPTWTKTGTTVSRNVTDLTGGLTATTTATGGTVLQLADIHGDVTVQQPLDTTVASTVQHYDEYGNALDDTAAVTYGWLGGRQRSSATLSGYTLMGVRVYDPATGRFLQTDPVVDGSPNHYGYPVDPVNMSDLTGQSWYYRLRCIALIASLL